MADVLDEKGKIKHPGEERRLLDATAKNPGMQRLIIAAWKAAVGGANCSTFNGSTLT